MSVEKLLPGETDEATVGARIKSPMGLPCSGSSRITLNTYIGGPTTPPAASDLRERARYVMNALFPWCGPSERELDVVSKHLTAIRAEAKAEGWNDAVKALRERAAEMKRHGADRWHIDYLQMLNDADWLAANRPTGRED